MFWLVLVLYLKEMSLPLPNVISGTAQRGYSDIVKTGKVSRTPSKKWSAQLSQVRELWVLFCLWGNWSSRPCSGWIKKIEGHSLHVLSPRSIFSAPRGKQRVLSILSHPSPCTAFSLHCLRSLNREVILMLFLFVAQGKTLDTCLPPCLQNKQYLNLSPCLRWANVYIT